MPTILLQSKQELKEDHHLFLLAGRAGRDLLCFAQNTKLWVSFWQQNFFFNLWAPAAVAAADRGVWLVFSDGHGTGTCLGIREQQQVVVPGVKLPKCGFDFFLTWSVAEDTLLVSFPALQLRVLPTGNFHVLQLAMPDTGTAAWTLFVFGSLCVSVFVFAFK